jgi:uncharacterized protein
VIKLDTHISALWRYPVKGFTPEPVTNAKLEAGGFFPFDRLYTFEVGTSGYQADDPKFITKMRYAVLARFSSVARFRTRYDEIKDRFHIDDRAYDLSQPSQRHAACRHLENEILQHDDYDPVAAPLRLLDIRDSHVNRFRFTDCADGFVSFLNLNSVRDLEQRLKLKVDPARFRANIWLEDIAAFEDHAWVGQRFSLGSVVFEGISPIVRCVATHVNTATARRDIDVCSALWEQYGHRELGLYARVVTSGRIEV